MQLTLSHRYLPLEVIGLEVLFDILLVQDLTQPVGDTVPRLSSVQAHNLGGRLIVIFKD
jgi:hypothetical protein